jgi:hypothetical protein
VRLAAPALSLSGHAVMLALAALLASGRPVPRGGLLYANDPLLAFDVVDTLEEPGSGISASAVDQATAERDEAAQGQPPAARVGATEAFERSTPREREPVPGRARANSGNPPASPSPPTPEAHSPAIGATAREPSPPPPTSSAEPRAAEPGASRPNGVGARRAAVPSSPSGTETGGGSSPPEGATAAGAGDPASSGAGGGPRRDRRPDVLERFSHELPSLAFGVSAWAALPPGESGPVTIVLALDERGEVALRGEAAIEADRCESARADRADARCAHTRAAYESARRTVDALYGRFELPGARLGAGRVRLELVATLSGATGEAATPADGTDAPIELGSTTIADRRASAHFVKSDGRRVDFALELLAAEPTSAEPGPPNRSDRRADDGHSRP